MPDQPPAPHQAAAGFAETPAGATGHIAGQPPLASHPGAPPYPADVAAAVARARAALPADYRPRTRHYDGAEHSGGDATDPYAPAGARANWTGRLILETSPYLRQHAHNPVDWRPWGAAAFAEARALGRPIFLSIGYATCHWCHVMEHQSFEDLEIATLLNSRYVPIKVDREERPDIDAVYMAAVQAMSGHGGWPMSVWIAPGPAEPGHELDGLPFFAGTYFPARAGDGGGGYGFIDVLRQLADRYADDRPGLVVRGAQVADHIRAQLSASWHAGAIDPGAVARLASQLAGAFDPVHGGLQQAPKFPSHVPIGLLLRHNLRSGDGQSRHIALHTLAQMSMGGIYDHVGGGFARYSTDVRWLVPHFEKMLYDQALIGGALVDAWQASGEVRFARPPRETLDYLLREMQSPTGGFWSATDADSEGHEGRFFVWSLDELVAALGGAANDASTDAGLIINVYGATAAGNFERRNILHLDRSLEAEADRRGVDPVAFASRVRGLLDRLAVVRGTRVPPLRDDKILASWNGLVLGTLARAGFVLDEPRYIEAARRAATFVTTVMRDGSGRPLRVAHGERAHVAGHLDDHAFVIAGLIDLFEATGEANWLADALALQRHLDDHFAAPDGGYYATADDGEALLAREIPGYDGAEPSGNSICAQNLLRLAALTGRDGFADRASRTLNAFARRLNQTPLAMTEMLVAAEMQAAPLREAVLVRAEGSSDAAFAPMRAALRSCWQPFRVVVQVEAGAALAALTRLAPAVGDKVARQGAVTAYVCEHGACALPTRDPAILVAQLRRGMAQP